MLMMQFRSILQTFSNFTECNTLVCSAQGRSSLKNLWATHMGQGFHAQLCKFQSFIKFIFPYGHNIMVILAISLPYQMTRKIGQTDPSIFILKIPKSRITKIQSETKNSVDTLAFHFEGKEGFHFGYWQPQSNQSSLITYSLLLTRCLS